MRASFAPSIAVRRYHAGWVRIAWQTRPLFPLSKADLLSASVRRHGLSDRAATLQAKGYVTPSGRRYSASAVASMLA